MPCRNKADKFCKFCWARKKKTTSPSCSGSNLQVPTSPCHVRMEHPTGQSGRRRRSASETWGRGPE